MEAIKSRYDEIYARCAQTPMWFIHESDRRKALDVPPEEREAFWEKLYAEPGFGIWIGNFRDIMINEKANAAISEFIAKKIRQRVKDPRVADKLIPKDHGFGTRRVPLAVIMGIVVWFWMTDRPAEARWLNAEERGWLTAVMDKERRVVEAIGRISVLKTLVNPQVLAIAAIHFAQAGVSVGIAVFTALIIKQLGFTIMQTGFLTAVPYVLGTIGILVWGHISDRMNERRWNLAASCFCMASASPQRV